MSDQPVKFPPEEYFQEQKVTPGEEPTKPRRKPAKGKSILGKLLFILVIIALITFGFITTQKTLANLETQAQTFAAQTATQSALSSAPQRLIEEATPSPAETTISTALPPTATVDPDFIHTATLSVLLTQATQ